MLACGDLQSFTLGSEVILQYRFLQERNTAQTSALISKCLTIHIKWHDQLLSLPPRNRRKSVVATNCLTPLSKGKSVQKAWLFSLSTTFHHPEMWLTVSVHSEQEDVWAGAQGLAPFNMSKGQLTEITSLSLIKERNINYAWPIKWNRDRYKYINNLKRVHE